MVDSQARCPDPEVLAAYVDRGLSLAERVRVESHLALCSQCIALVAGVVRTVAEVSEFTPHVEVAVESASRANRRSLVGVLAAAAAVFVVLAVPSVMRPWLERDAGLVNLVGVSEQRSVLGRLTGGFPHAPLGVPSAGGQDGRAAETDRILLAAAKIRESFGERETPSRLHALGVSQLIAGQYDEAARSLLSASREQPANARYLNDVATMQLERARLGLRPDDLPRALAAADRARRLDPSLEEAWFNRALAMTALSLTDQAKAAWADYLERDSSSDWATEARLRLAELTKPTAAAAWLSLEPELRGTVDAALADRALRVQMTEARGFLENEVLPNWASAVESGGDDTAELERIRAFADAFARIAGDAIYKDTVIAIDRARARGPEALRALAAAHRRYAEAARAFAEDRFPAARPGFEVAQAELRAAGSPLAVRAVVELGAIAHITGRSDEAASLLLEGLEAADRAGYAYAAARSTWFMGLAAFGRGRLDEVQSRYEETLAAFVRMGDAEQMAAAHNLLASLHGYLGDERRAWEHRRDALPALAISRSGRLRYGLLVGAAAAVRRQDPEAALAFQDAVVSTARDARLPGAVTESLSQRAQLLVELGNQSQAHQDVVSARSGLRAIPDPALRRFTEVSLLAAESDVLRTVDPARSVAAAEAALERVTQRGDRLRIAQLSLKLAKANIVWGNLTAAELALNVGIQAFDDERASLSDEGRISTLDESWQLFDTAVQLAITKKDYPRAFAMSERARARTPAERTRATGRALADVEASLQPAEAIVALNQFDNELAVWVIRRSGTTVVMRPLSRVGGHNLVARQQDEIANGATTPSASKDLYDEILRPVARQLTGVARLSVVPDARYANASFGAFWDASKRQFLVEQMIVTTAPSVTSVATGSLADSPADLTEPLILGGPEDAAAAQARAVAAAYGNPEVLTGSAATRSRFLADAPSRAIIHIAAPTRSNDAYPHLSGLLLSSEGGQRHSGNLLGREIAAQSMPRTRLVSIDAIDVDGSNSEGSRDLARAFMAAGVPTVLGTLPGADEAATRQLMVGFHRLMSTGIPADEALNTLQRNVLHSNGRRLGAWCALVLYGSDR